MDLETQSLKTVLDYFLQWEREMPDAPFLRQPEGKTWKITSWAEAGRQARQIAAAIQGFGLQPGDHVGIVSKNCAHWIIADLAIMMGRFVSVPFYPNLTGRQLGEVVRMSDIKALFVGKLDDWNTMKSGIPEEIALIRFPAYPGNSLVQEGMDWEEALNTTGQLNESPKPALHDLWTILFTSGTTGSPKGVMLTYFAPAAMMENERVHNTLQIFSGESHRFFSYLPLNHIAERMIVEVAAILTGGTISFGESLDTFARNLRDTRPTLFLAVPRIWAKFQMGILEKISPGKLNRLLRLPWVSGMVKNKIRKGLGLDQTRIFLTGAAPTPDALKAFFLRLGLPIQEVYAMTENCGGCALMPKSWLKPGTVGKPLPNVDLRIAPETGEVLMRAPWNMTGYFRDPEKTAEVLQDGWLHTGDQGEIDEEGFLRLTGRVTDTFKSAKGKFIVPAPIEWGFAENPLIEQICVTGRTIPQPLALVVLSERGLQAPREWVQEQLRLTLQEVNATLAKFECIKSLVILQEPWTVDNGVLTPTLKIRREVLNQRFEDRFWTWYARKEEIIWESDAMASWP